MRSIPTLALTLLLAASAGLTGCAEAQRMMTDAATIANTAGGAAGDAGMASTSEASWTTNGADNRGRSGTFAYDCPPVAEIPHNYTYGSNPYADTSPVCVAGVHAGVITTRGGRVNIQPRPGQRRFAGSTRNGVETRDMGTPSSGSFLVVR